MRKRLCFGALVVALLATACVPSPFGDARAFEHGYYVSPTGSDTTGNGSDTAPWRTFAKALGVLKAGDALVLMDGTYKESLTLPTTLNGTETSRIVIGAQHDGKALINGESTRIPIRVRGNDYIDIEGIVAYNSSAGVIAVESGSSYDTFRGVSGYNTAATCTSSTTDKSTCNHQIWEIVGSNHVVVEDCVAAGRARSVLYVYQSSYTTLRRCWLRGDRGTGWSGSYDDHGGYTSYQSDHTVLENNIIADPVPSEMGSAHGIHDWNNVYGGPNAQVNVKNRYFGNIMGSIYENAMGVGGTQCKLTRDHEYHDNVVIESQKLSGAWRRGMAVRLGKNLLLDHFTLIGDSVGVSDDKQQGLWLNASVYSDQDKDCSPLDSSGKHYGPWGFYKDSSTSSPTQHSGFDFTVTVKNTVIQGFRVGFEAETSNSTPPVITASHNNVQGNGTNYLGSVSASGGTGNTSTALTWDTTKYGKGAYFMGATNAPVGDDGQPVGAHVLYEYKDGALTGTHLWPFPMEDRIWNETGNTALWEGANSLYKAHQQSATWDGVTVSGQLRTGGWWKTLDAVYP
jgi:hypothetical protein